MPILETLPDPRLQIFLDFVGQLQQARRQEEEERARSRERLRQRQMVGGGLALGAVGGALLAPAAVASAGVGSGFAAGTALTAAGTPATAGLLGSMLVGAGMGAQAGGALARDDYGAAAQQAIQGTATLANLPALQEQGFSPLEVAMAGSEGIPSLLSAAQTRRRQLDYATLRDAQMARRQEEDLIRRETADRRRRDDAFQRMPPHLQTAIKTAENYIDRARIDLLRGEFGSPDSPQAIEAFNQAIVPHVIEIKEARKWEPPPQPTIDEIIKEGKEVCLRPELGGGFTRNVKGELKWFKTSPSFTALERAELLQEKSQEFELQFKDEQIAQLQRRIVAEGESQEKALAEAKKRIEGDVAYTRMAHDRAQQAAEQYVEQLMPRARIAHLQPTANEQKQQQEAAEQQQQAQETAAQEQQFAQLQTVFSESAQTLMAIGHEWGTAPSEWPKSRVEAARPSAEAFLQTLPALLPMMTQEQAQEARPVIVFATAIARQQRTLSIPEVLPNEIR
jgi:hypothetical protein